MRETIEQLLVNVQPLTAREIKEGQDVYTAAIREWVAYKIRSRGHTQVTRFDVRNCKFGANEPWGSDVTPPEDPELSLLCEVRLAHRSESWHSHEEDLTDISPAQFVMCCNGIAVTISERNKG